LGVVGDLAGGFIGATNPDVANARSIFDPSETRSNGSGSQRECIRRAEDLLQGKRLLGCCRGEKREKQEKSAHGSEGNRCVLLLRRAKEMPHP
jgi:hypothetical protein